MSDQKTGTVKWYNPEKAFGFITVDDGRDVFVHRSALGNEREWLVEGQEVRMDVRNGAKGPEAADVTVTRDVEATPRIRAYQERNHYDSAPSRPANGYNSGGQSFNRSAAPRREREPYRGPTPVGDVRAVVQRVDPNGRFLFARVDEYGFDVYVHNTLYARSAPNIREGDAIYVTVQESDRGMRAVTFRLA